MGSVLCSRRISRGIGNPMQNPGLQVRREGFQEEVTSELSFEGWVLLARQSSRWRRGRQGCPGRVSVRCKGWRDEGAMDWMLVSPQLYKSDPREFPCLLSALWGQNEKTAVCSQEEVSHQNPTGLAPSSPTCEKQIPLVYKPLCLWCFLTGAQMG